MFKEEHMEKIKLYQLRNSSGFGVDVSNLGGTVVSLYTPDRDGNILDVALGFDELSDYLDNSTLPPMAARLLISRAALPGTAWQCLMLQMRCGRRSIRKQKRPSVLFLFMWYSIHRKIDGGIPP